MDIFPEIKYGRKNSSMFRHVEIDYISETKQHLDVTWWKRLEIFLDILTTNWQLLPVKFRNLEWHISPLDSLIRDDIFRAICSLLESQHHLKQVEFHIRLFQFCEGVELLKNIKEHNRQSLLHLVLRAFVKPMNLEQLLIVEQSLPTLVSQRFPRLLITLETDYSLIFHSMLACQSAAIDTLNNCRMRVLSMIVLT
ncbi:hypothetical protein AVEN_69456-1 [Araneus ventricosus]|uniref:Uncharacterized protein n=1 Tax=Araneus ventricosus TaxID=182803 RepID=A0A4Y1ZMQ3_ARAVE|nr:hypothetical protein AVEN_69456-1 [Araneus ventricosus]